MEKLLIIGAGLSGLYAAYRLQARYEIIMLEARPRIGGRILTVEGHDLGPSWIWPHHTRMHHLTKAMGLQHFRQFDHGDALYQTPAGIQRFTPPPQAESYRIDGGLSRLTDALADQLNDVEILLDQPVHTITNTGNNITVLTANQEFETDRLILAIPPRVVRNILFEPPLERDLQEKLNATPTWMGHARKCVITYNTPFWREEGLSGFVFSHTGPMGEVHDATTSDEAALFGFLAGHAGEENIEAAVIEQLRNLFGEAACHYNRFHWHDWRSDPLTGSLEDRHMTVHPDYGLDLSAGNGRIHFLSTEHAYDEGGYLEGALSAAHALAQQL
jgi:monoamine oxidase